MMPLTEPWVTLRHLDHDEAMDAWRAELIEGQLLLTAPPSAPHQRIISDVIRALITNAPADRLAFWAGGSGLRLGPATAVKPDVIVSDPNAFAHGTAEYNPVAGEPLHLVVEVTSTGSRHQDHHQKASVYAAAGIPHYLIIDRQDRACFLHSLATSARAYAPAVTAAFGEPLPLPSPLGFDLDTSTFD